MADGGAQIQKQPTYHIVGPQRRGTQCSCIDLRPALYTVYIKTEWTNGSTCIIETNEAWAKKRIINLYRNHNMKETHGFSKQYNVCINELISLHLEGVWLRYMDFLRAFLRAKSLIKSLKVSDKWRAEVWWCPGRLLDCMPPTAYQIVVLRSSVWWSLLLDIRCLQSHNLTSYWRFQTNILAKFIDAIILFYTHSTYSLLYNVPL